MEYKFQIPALKDIKDDVIKRLDEMVLIHTPLEDTDIKDTCVSMYITCLIKQLEAHLDSPIFVEMSQKIFDKMFVEFCEKEGYRYE